MIPFIPNPADKSGGPHRDNHHFQQMIAQKECIAPQHTRSFCRRFTPTKSFACTAWAVFFFSGNFSGQGPSILLSCCARPSRCLKAPLGLSLLRYACKRKPYLENFMSRPNVIPAFCQRRCKTGAGTSFGANGDSHYMSSTASTYFLRLNNSETFVENAF